MLLVCLLAVCCVSVCCVVILICFAFGLFGWFYCFMLVGLLFCGCFALRVELVGRMCLCCWLFVLVVVCVWFGRSGGLWVCLFWLFGNFVMNLGVDTCCLWCLFNLVLSVVWVD